MLWQIKAGALAMLSRTPGGRPLYSRAKRLTASWMLDGDEMLDRATDLLALYRRYAPASPPSACLEIGTGWTPIVPLLLRASGVQRVVTLDVNRWLSVSSARATARTVRQAWQRLQPQLPWPATDDGAWLDRAACAPTLSQWVSITGITYECVADTRRTGLESETMDAVFSSNVLEHVPTGVLPDLHAETRRLVRPGGLIVHRLNPQDHFGRRDRGVTGANFLQYSSAQWNALCGGLAYHNRLRCVQHLSMIEAAGLTIVSRQTRSDPRAQAAIESGRLRVHPEFARFTVPELTDDYLWVVATR